MKNPVFSGKGSTFAPNQCRFSSFSQFHWSCDMHVRVIPIVLALSVAACGGGGGGGGGSVTPPTPSNRAPVLATIGNISVNEGSTAVTTVSATDADGDTLTYSLGGTDSDDFTLSGTTLTFSSAPSYASPTDANTDNVYQITITVTDGTASDSETFNVTVLPQLNGRVVDGPVVGASCVVWVDGAQTNQTGTTDANGFYNLGDLPVSGDVEVRCTGGTDGATGADLTGLTLTAEVPSGATSVNINGITTVLAAADTPEEKQAILDKLGIDATPEELAATDIWAESESGDATAQAAQRANSQLITVIETATTIVEESTGGAVDPLDVINAVVDQVISAADAVGEDLNLADPATLNTVLTNAVATSAPTANVDPAVITAVSNTVSEVNSVLADETQNPTSASSTAVAAAAQTTLQTSVGDVSSGQTDVSTFEAETDPATLFEDVPVDPAAPDNDQDGLADSLDPDDDNDGVADASDAFPFDDSESVDTDGDGTGNNADTDDDNDTVADGSDAYPLDDAISTTALEIARGSKFTVTDYNPSTQQQSTFMASFTTAGAVMKVNTTANPLNLQNLQNVIAGSNFQSPTVSMPVVTVPNGTGTPATVFKVIDGADSTPDTGERVISLDVDLSWQGDGSILVMSVPPQTATGFYTTSSGTQINLSVENFAANVITVNTGANISVDLQLAALLAAVQGALPSSFLRAGTYTMTIDFDDLPVFVSTLDNAGTVVTQVEVTFAVQ
jgi:hypothetical protein